MTEVKIEQAAKATNIEPPRQADILEHIQGEGQKIDNYISEHPPTKTKVSLPSQRDSQQVKRAEDIQTKPKDQDDKKSHDKVLNKNHLQEIKKATNQVLEQINIELDFSIDKDLNTVVVKVINKETGKVIRQIPPEEMLKIAKRIEEMTGLLLDRWS